MQGPRIPALPARSLVGSKPLRYVPAARTDVRRTFRRARLLARLRSPALPGSTPVDERDHAGPGGIHQPRGHAADQGDAS